MGLYPSSCLCFIDATSAYVATRLIYGPEAIVIIPETA
jgi:hypothetical protein